MVMVVMTGLMVAIDTIDDSFGTTAGAIYELCLRYQWGIDKLQYDVISRLRVPLPTLFQWKEIAAIGGHSRTND